MDVVLIGFGAIGQSICRRLMAEPSVRISHVVVRPKDLARAQLALDSLLSGSTSARPSQAVSEVPPGCRLLLECAGHEALVVHVLPALARGVECAVLSMGALAEPGLVERLSDAARQGATQVHLLSGAIGGIEALAAAKLAGLTSVTYTGRKPPSAWAPITDDRQAVVPQDHVKNDIEATILESSAREAARLYPKNANVAATIALAGLGLDATRVRLIADPAVTDNIHEIHAKGAFGEMKIEMRGKPLADNPKTSALTVLSALRFLLNRASPLTI